ncbi:MAG: MIP family channel protein [Planctomycetota bacterium]|jgi:aquaporin NIP|nr:MIP family channel protein [Planctomycetota bacterium]
MELPKNPFLQKCAAEFIGTFALVFFGCGAASFDALPGLGGGLGHLGVSLVFGSTIMVMIFATGHLSGAHFNPAVTISFAVTKKFKWTQVPGYILAQCMGATVAALLLASIVEGSIGASSTSLGATLPLVETDTAFLLEAVFSFFLMFVISAVATDSRAVGELAGIAIGGTVALIALVGGPLTGASMNPARSLGPALATGRLDFMPLYIAGPLVGAVVGALVYEKIRCEKEDTGASGCC